MQPKTIRLDPRYFQVIFQAIFLTYGIFVLHWPADWLHYITTITGCLFFNWLAESLRQQQWLPVTGNKGWRSWGFSVLISAASLCLLLKTGSWTISLLAACCTVASKYVFRIK